MEKVRDCVPPPHVALQVPHEPHAPTQSTGHAPVLQLWLRLSPAEAVHDVPPFAEAFMIVYVCDCVPPPHVAEQVPHELHTPTQCCTRAFLNSVTSMEHRGATGNRYGRDHG